MKLNILSPLPPAHTCIAENLWHTLPALEKLAEITLWTTQSEWDSNLEQWAKVRCIPFEQEFWHELQQADMTVYHIGNNVEFHGEIWDLSQRHPGVVILHDLSLQHLFSGIFLDYQQDCERYVRVMEEFYGDEGRQMAERRIRCECTPEDLSIRFPLTELGVSGTLGVLVHARDGFEALASRERCPIRLAGLPFAPTAEPQRRLAPVGDVRRLIVFGYLGPNRRIASVLQALSELPERDLFRLDIYGKMRDSSALLKQRDGFGLQEIVRLRGFVPEAELIESLQRADLAINLRYPTMGEASGSQLCIWNYSVPSLVTRIGWYSEIPESAVAFAKWENEVEEIKRHLRGLLANPEAYSRIGKAGRKYLEENHSPTSYAKEIVALASEASKFRVTAGAFRLAERAGSQLCWSNPSPRTTTSRRSANTILSLLSG
jgi:glycosyltransferase involved in cell wall biosynthesis